MSQPPIEVAYHAVERTWAVTAEVNHRVSGLAATHAGLEGCWACVVRAGTSYRVRVRLRVSGRDLVVGQHAPSRPHDDPIQAVRDAFVALEAMVPAATEQRRRGRAARSAGVA